MYRGLRHPIETFRTTPIQIGLTLLSLSVASVYANSELGENNNPADVADWAVISINLGSAGLNSVLAYKQVKFRNRLESKLEDKGFNERVMSRTTTTYCARQAARIACENTGHLDEYTELCEKNSEKASLTWLPHI